MTGGAIAAGLLLAALALATGFAQARQTIVALALAIFLALAVVLIGVEAPSDVAFAGCWISVVATVVPIYLPGSFPFRRFSLSWPALGANAGVWAGLVLPGDLLASRDLAGVLIILFLAALSRFCVARGWPLVPRVVASWLLAVALLAGSIPYLVEHPGYVSDHQM
ncbi:MAG: hypothetical protein WA957_01250 [Alteraurantiacibacter sp.]